MHSGEIIADLGILAVMGVLSAAACRMLRVPGMIGYLVTGVVVGPHALGWVHTKDVMMLGELGVVFLMFHLGMRLNKLCLNG